MDERTLFRAYSGLRTGHVPDTILAEATVTETCGAGLSARTAPRHGQCGGTIHTGSRRIPCGCPCHRRE